MLNNPIIRRELLGMLRRPHTLVIFAAMIAVLAVAVVALWPDNATVALHGSVSQQVFAVFTYGLLVCLLMSVPAFPATAIVNERNSGTLTLLLTSPLTSGAILIGKVSAVIGFVGSLLALSMPGAVACFVMGGIDARQIFAIYAILALAATQYATLGLLVSSFSRSADAALRMTYGLVLVMSVLVIGPYKLLQGQLAGIGNTLLNLVYCISPIPAITQVLGRGETGSLGFVNSYNQLILYLITSALSIIICVIWLAIRLQPTLLDRSRATGKITDDRSRNVQRFRKVMFLGGFDPQKREGAIGFNVKAFIIGLLGFVVFAAGTVGYYLYASSSDMFKGDWTQLLIPAAIACMLGFAALVFGFTALMSIVAANPVVIKEFRTRTLGRSHWMLRMIGACMIVSLGLALATSTWAASQPDKLSYLGGVLVIFQMALVLLLTPALSAGLISSEVESNGWQLLQVTRLSPLSIIAGKLLSVAWTLIMLLAATIPGYIVLLVIDFGYAARVGNTLICLLLASMFALTLGAACSSLFRRTAVATAVAYLLVIALSVGTLVSWLGQGVLFSQQLVSRVLTISPVASALAAMRMPGFDEYRIVGAHWTLMGILTAFCLLVLWGRARMLCRPD